MSRVGSRGVTIEAPAAGDTATARMVPGVERQLPDSREALATLDRLARYCEFTCDLHVCHDEECEAWRNERAAADWLIGRYLDGQD